MATRSRLRRLMYRWHRWLGLAASVFVLLLAITGILLNHSERLGLDGKHVGWGPLLDWYGLAPEHPPQAYRLASHWLLLLEGQAYLDGVPVVGGLGTAAGAVALPSGLLIAGGAQGLALLTPQGQLIERLAPQALPGSPRRLGVADGRLVIATPEGRHMADEDLLAWQPTAVVPDWAEPDTPPAALRDQVLEQYRGEGLPWTRVLADMHSGRILGPAGAWLMDLAALALLVLVASGIYNWASSRP